MIKVHVNIGEKYKNDLPKKKKKRVESGVKEGKKERYGNLLVWFNRVVTFPNNLNEQIINKMGQGWRTVSPQLYFDYLDISFSLAKLIFKTNSSTIFQK